MIPDSKAHEDGENESFEEYEDMYEEDYSEMSESMPDSIYNEGDLASGFSMQPLPLLITHNRRHSTRGKG